MADAESFEFKYLHDVWMVERNSDGTEGRGQQLVKALCEKEATARRLANGCDVQGSDGHVTRVPIFQLKDGPWFNYGPVTIVSPTREDIAEQVRLDADAAARERYAQAVERAKLLGLSDEDLAVLQKACAGGR